MVLGITDLSSYLIGVALIILLPGPNSLYVLSVAARRGVGQGYRAACGVFTGDAVLMVLSAVGVGALLQANDVAFSIVKYLGAGYLGWLAISMLRGAWGLWRSRRTVAEEVEGAAAERGVSSTPGEHPYRRALVISLLNPKAILFFVAFFVQFVDPAYPQPWLTFLALGALAQIASFAYLTALIFGGTRMAETFRRHKRVSAAGSSAVGAVFLGFAIKLALASA